MYTSTDLMVSTWFLKKRNGHSNLFLLLLVNQMIKNDAMLDLNIKLFKKKNARNKMYKLKINNFLTLIYKKFYFKLNDYFFECLKERKISKNYFQKNEIKEYLRHYIKS